MKHYGFLKVSVINTIIIITKSFDINNIIESFENKLLIALLTFLLKFKITTCNNKMFYNLIIIVINVQLHFKSNTLCKYVFNEFENVHIRNSQICKKC